MNDEVEEVEQEEVEVELESEEFDYEAAARQEGWVSKEEWVESGKPEAIWKPAKDFYEAGQTILPIVQAKNKRLQKDLEELQRKVNKMADTHEMSLKMQREAWEKELKKAKAQAIRDGDGDKVNEIDDQIRQLHTPQQNGPDPEVIAALNDFQTSNDWYGTDEDMTVFADAYAAKLKQGNPNIPARELLTKVTAKTRDAFKSKFVKKVPTVESPTRGTAKPSKKKDYDGLPREAKQACEIFLDNIPDGQKDEFRNRYVANYYAEE